MGLPRHRINPATRNDRLVVPVGTLRYTQGKLRSPGRERSENLRDTHIHMKPGWAFLQKPCADQNNPLPG